MTAVAISAQGIEVRFNPYVEKAPTLRRSIARGRVSQREEVVALDGVSFEILRGEAFGIVGSNGAGKSTLLRVLARTLRPDAGSVTVNGRTSTLLQLGVGFNRQLSGRRNIYLGCLANGLTVAEIEGRLDSILDYAELGSAIERPMTTYSSGMFSRLAFSISMHLDPDILLVDEVLSVGDEDFRRKSMKTMLELLERSGTIVYVSHNLDSVEQFSDRVMWLEKGKVLEIGDPAEIVADYRKSIKR